MNFKDTIMFTGAGFTSNFGGFLGREMWAKIFNNPKLNNAPAVKAQLRKGFDFEELYSLMLKGQSRSFMPDQQVEIFEEVVDDAYTSLDNAIKSRTWSHEFGIHSASLRYFLDYFKSEDNNSIGISFTLNQDLFLERHYDWEPCVPRAMTFARRFDTLDSDDTSLKSLPTEEELNDFKSNLSTGFAYIKLHGSSRWIAPDGKNTKIIGVNKIETINRIPLLKWYFELFQAAICRNNVKLVVIGYGFKDKHINECIAKAVTENGLKLYIISTEDPDDFSFRIKNKYPKTAQLNDIDEIGSRIWNGVEGYFPYKLKDIFPLSQRNTTQKTEIYNAIGIQ